VDALDAVVRTSLPSLHHRAFRLTRDHEAAQDLVQDTLERAYRKLVHFQPGTNMHAWLACIMRNLWISRYRRRGAVLPTVSLDEMAGTVPDLSPGRASATSEVEATVVDALSVTSIHLAIEGLPIPLRQVVVLADLEETPYGTIAAALAIPPGTVASRLFRGRRRLQQMLHKQVRGDERLARAG
jgi:RNA polymerase sigma-70 factor (ECF subfamily)